MVFQTNDLHTPDVRAQDASTSIDVLIVIVGACARILDAPLGHFDRALVQPRRLPLGQRGQQCSRWAPACRAPLGASRESPRPEALSKIVACSQPRVDEALKLGRRWLTRLRARPEYASVAIGGKQRQSVAIGDNQHAPAAAPRARASARPLRRVHSGYSCVGRALRTPPQSLSTPARRTRACASSTTSRSGPARAPPASRVARAPRRRARRVSWAWPTMRMKRRRRKMQRQRLSACA